MLSTGGRANLRVTAAALVLLLGALAASDLIPARRGRGYDGFIYSRWAQALSFSALFAAAESLGK